MEGHLSALHDLREEARDQGQINAAITAEIHRGKVGGLYIDRREVLTAQIDSLSKDQILDRLGQLITKRMPQTIEGSITNRLGSDREPVIEGSTAPTHPPTLTVHRRIDGLDSDR